MDLIITFFRDILDGPLYIVVTVICSILICACIGYLAEKSQNKRKKKEQYVEAPSISPAVTSVTSSVPPVVTTYPTTPQVVPNSMVQTTPNTVASSGSTQTAKDTHLEAQPGPVQIDMPQVVAIPVAEGASAFSNSPLQTPVIATAPSVQPTSSTSVVPPSTVAVPSQSTGVPTSVNQ